MMPRRQPTNEISSLGRLTTSNIHSNKSTPPSSDAAAALLELHQSSTPLVRGGSFTTKPLKHRVNSRTGLVNGTMRVERIRTAGGRTLLRFEYCLELERDGTSIPVLVAMQRQEFFSQSKEASKTQHNRPFASGKDWMNEKRHFIIAQHNKQTEALGEISVSPLQPQVVAFSVTLMDQVDSCILYKVHSLPSIFSNAPPPRQIEFVRFTERAQLTAAKEGGTAVESSNFYRSLLNESCEFLQPKAETSPHKALCDTNYLSIFYSERPFIKVETKAPTLNMKGRGRVASSKNTQLVNQDGVVCLQVAKCDHTTYHVDFRAPFNPFQAFAFGIAQVAL